MSTTDQFLFALQAYPEIKADLSRDGSPLPVPAQISSPKTLAGQVATLPGGSILLGLAEDGLPLLLNLYDPAPGPLLVAGDGGSGKTAFLQSLAQASNLQNPGEVQFGVLTPFPEEWTEQGVSPNCLGIWPAYHPAACSFMSRLVSWAQVLPDIHQAVLVLFDGLDLLTASSFQIRHELRWLLMYGPERHVWPVVTVNPGRLARLETWLDYFQTRILGQVKRQQTARLLVDDPEINLAGLLPGRQFGLSRPEGWLKFWLPPVG